MTKIIKPVIVVGTGRCGSTLFHSLLANHERLMWLSGFALVFPNRPGLNRWIVSAMDNRLLRRLLGGKIRPLRAISSGTGTPTDSPKPAVIWCGPT